MTGAHVVELGQRTGIDDAVDLASRPQDLGR
jgi:hypothetical protein